MMKWVKHIIYLSFIFSFIVFYIWWRLIYERLPKDIPVKLSLIGSILLVIVCYGYFFSVYNNYRVSKPSLFFNFSTYILKSLEYISHYFEKEWEDYYISYHNFLRKKIQKTNINILTMFITVIPKFLLLISLAIDTFFFNQLFYFYKLLFLYIFILIFNIIKKDWEYHLLKVNEDFKRILNIHPLEITNLLQEIRANNTITLLEYVKIQTYYVKHYQREMKVLLMWTDEYVDDLKKMFNLSTVEVNHKVFRKTMKSNLNYHRIVYQFLEDYKQTREKYKRIIALLDTIFFLTWSYILVISLYTFPLENIAWLYLFYPPGNPFE